jgi:3-deoxy-manno-octulosonate cytidylyltransferase (CMP-KDO synthetase)
MNLSYSLGLKTTALVIPARMDSKRFFGKLLEPYKGKEILRHVLDTALTTEIPDAEVWVATDSEVIAEKASEWGAKVFISQPGLKNGTERIAEFSKSNFKDFYINIQGDDPTIIKSVISGTFERLVIGEFQVVTPIFKIVDQRVFEDSNKVKVVKKVDNSVLYFSRSPIPNFNSHISNEESIDFENEVKALGHIGVYGYTFDALKIYGGLPESPLEKLEKLEQLRFIENGIEIGTFEVDFVPSAIDSPKDLVSLNKEAK